MKSKKALRSKTFYFFFISSILINSLVRAQAPDVTYSAPIVITKGGTYTGNWESTISTTPAVTVNTSEPIIIENSIIKSAGDLIASSFKNANITVRNTSGYGLAQTVDNRPKGRFVTLSGFKNVVVEQCYMEGTSGIYLLEYAGNKTSGETVKIRYNKARNIDGRFRNGGRKFVQFAQLDKCFLLYSAEICWNEVINEPNNSAVEDNVNIFLSSGSSDSYIQIHNNYFQGGYHTDLSADKFSGGGIMVADGGNATSPKDVPSFVEAFDNQVIGTTNYGIAIASGHDNRFYNNRIIASGYLADGTYLNAQNVGAYIANPDKLPDTVFFNNTAYNNEIGWVNEKIFNKRNDMWFPACIDCLDKNTKILGTITKELEWEEYESWKQKLKVHNKSVGLSTVIEAENNYKILADQGSYNISVSPVAIHSNGASVKLYDTGDSIRISFNNKPGVYIIKARVRSGNYSSNNSNPKAYWDKGYSFSLNDSSIILKGDEETISDKDASFGGSFWGTMFSALVNLTSDSNHIDIKANTQWLGIDYIELEPVGDRIEAEGNHEIVADPGTHTINATNVSSHSGGTSVQLYDENDKISINFNTDPGIYIIKVRIRSGAYSSNSANMYSYCTEGYKLELNGALTEFTIDSTSISLKDGSYGGSYWGTMVTVPVTLQSFSNTLTIEALKSWAGIDYIEVLKVGSYFPLRMDEIGTSVKKVTFIQGVSAYPNPVNEILFIKGIKNSENYTISIYDYQGMIVVENAPLIYGTFIIDNVNLKKGVYLARIKKEDQEAVIRFVKE